MDASRALVFTNLKFQEGIKPPAPQYINNSETTTVDTISFTYKVEPAEEGVAGSSAKIIEATIDYSQNETGSATALTLDTTTLYEIANINPAVNGGVPFNLSLSNLRAGTKYNYIVKAKNNVSGTNSDYSSKRVSEFTELPGDNSISNVLLNVEISNSSRRYITNSSLNNSFQIWLNKGDATSKLIPEQTGQQTIQLTRPAYTNQQSETKDMVNI